MRESRRISVLLVLVGVFLLLAAYLLVSENPWKDAKAMADRVAEGKSVKLEYQVALGLFLAACLNLVICTGLLVAWWFFDCPLPGPNWGISGGEKYGVIDPPEPSGIQARLFCWVLLAIVLIGGGLRWHLASHSLWWDELWTVEKAVVGAYLPDKENPGALKFGDVSWERSAWYYRKPTNHAVASLSAKLVDSVWRNFTDAERHEFRDIMVRLPMLLSALVTMVVVGWLGWRWRMPWAGLAAAALLALHPWHIRYGVDVRAYSFVMLWTATGCLWLSEMVRQGRRSIFPWLMFGVNQFLLVWSFPYAVWLALGFFVSAVALIFACWHEKRDRQTALWTLLLVNSLAAVLFLQMFAPNLIQLKVWLADNHSQHSGHELNGARFQELLSQAFFGMPPNLPAEGGAAGLPSFTGQLQAHPVIVWGAILVLATATLVGGLYLARYKFRALLILAGIEIGGLLALAFFALVDTYFYHRFLVYLVLPVVFLPAVALQFVVAGREKRKQTAVGVAGLVLLPAIYAVVVWPQVKVLNQRSYAPLREVAGFFQEARGGVFSESATGGEKVLATTYGHGGETLHVYDPEVKVLRSLAELKAAIKTARESGARLLVAYDHRQLNEALVPDGFTWLDDPAKFKEVASFPAIEPDFFFRILEYTGK